MILLCFLYSYEVSLCFYCVQYFLCSCFLFEVTYCIVTFVTLTLWSAFRNTIKLFLHSLCHKFYWLSFRKINVVYYRHSGFLHYPICVLVLAFIVMSTLWSAFSNTGIKPFLHSACLKVSLFESQCGLL